MRNGFHFFITTLLIAVATPAKAAPGKFRVVLDPGHGGVDEGAVYKEGHQRFTEKEITLTLARKAKELLKGSSVDVVLTRETDLDLSLPVRTSMANRLKADVFLSLHVNSTSDPTEHARGIETYILSHSTDQAGKRLAQLENKGIGTTSIADHKTSSGLNVALIVKELTLDGNLGESKRLACLLQGELVDGLSTHSDRGVRQAYFHVLLGANMPSALIETGFINHAEDRKRLTTPAGLDQLARSLVKGILGFQKNQSSLDRHRVLSRCQVRGQS